MAPKKQTKTASQKEGKVTKDKVILKAETRSVVGKATRNLRKQGILPSNIFGKDMESQTIQVQLLDFRHTFAKVRETGVVYVDVDGKSVPCLIRNIQKHPVTGGLLHADFRKINLKQKTEAEVPIQITGESDAVKTQNGVLITQMETLTVEALPTEIPSEIEIDISVLKEIGDEIKVKDLKTTEKVAYTDDPEAVIVSVTAHKEEETEPDTEAEAPEIESEEKKEEEEKENPEKENA
jgi:large subunit ribosomal protein L25